MLITIEAQRVNIVNLNIRKLFSRTLNFSACSKRFRIIFTENGRNDHMTMFMLHLPLVVFSFSVKLSCFALASNISIVLHLSHQCIHFIKKSKHASHVCFSPETQF